MEIRPDRGNRSFSPEAATDLFDALAQRVADLVIARLGQSEPASASPWLDIEGAAEYAAMSPDALHSARKRGQLRAYHSETGRIRFRREDLDAFLYGSEAAA